jgi:DNA polymerase
MADETLANELTALIEDARAHLSYARELGVAGLELSQSEAVETPATAPTERVERPSSSIPRHAALERNAVRATQVDDAASQRFSQSTAQNFKPDAAAQDLKPNAAPAAFEKTEMATRSKEKKYPDANPPPPMETLFGEITPQDQESLPQANETLEDIWQDIGVCMRCPLCQSRNRIVNSEGNRQARLMFIGEAPGADEDASGRPFVGRAGQLLNKIIEAIGLKREDVMIGNVNRCRPPQNRTPTIQEAATCKPFLLREVAIIRPEVIVVLGNTAMKNLLDTKEGITKLRGKFQDYRGIKVMPTFHPAYLLRDPSKKREAWEDMKLVRDYLDGKIKA